MLITVYIVLLLLNKLIDMGCAGGAISPLRSSRKERKQEGGYTVASSKPKYAISGLLRILPYADI